jgi:hypothetical protein
MYEVERAADRERLLNRAAGGAVADQHVHLVRVHAKSEIRRRSTTAEALERRTADANQLLQRSASPCHAPAARAFRLPADDHHDRGSRRYAIGRDLAHRRPRSHAFGSHHEQRVRIGDRSLARRRHTLPACWQDDLYSARGDGTTAAERERRQCEDEHECEGVPHVHRVRPTKRPRSYPSSQVRDARRAETATSSSGRGSPSATARAARARSTRRSRRRSRCRGRPP